MHSIAFWLESMMGCLCFLLNLPPLIMIGVLQKFNGHIILVHSWDHKVGVVLRVNLTLFSNICGYVSLWCFETIHVLSNELD